MTQPTPPVDPASPLGWLDELVQPSSPAPLQASDPAHLANGMVVPRSEPPAVGGGSYTVDLAHAPAAIRELEHALEQLKGLRKDAVALGSVRPPAADPVSRDAAQVLGAVATGGSGSLVHALDAGIKQVSALIGHLRDDLAAYRSAEESSAYSLTDRA